jgi:hypothetical protein
VGRSRAAAALAAVALLAAAGSLAGGCGDDQDRTATVIDQAPATTTSEAPTSTSVPLQTETNAVTITTQPPSTTPTATTGVPPAGGDGGTQAPDANGGTPAGDADGRSGEAGEGGAGDEEAARVPATFKVSATTFSPAQITVPAFLAVDLSVTATGAAQTVTIEGAGTLDVGAGATAHQQLAGLKPGDYALTTAGGAKATLHVVNGGDPGP